MLWYHRENVEKVAKVDNVEKVDKVPNEPADKTIKVTNRNRKRINTLVGELASDGESHSQNDAIDYLFDCKEKLEKILKEKKEKNDEG